ncbi:MAG: fumarylacetoacetase [Vulcanimicrobiaceae bacterium]
MDNLPYGVFSAPDRSPRVGVAYEDAIVDLAVLCDFGLLEGPFSAPSLNAFLAQGPDVWQRTHATLQELFEARRIPRESVVLAANAAMHLPIEIGDYVDFYSSLEHATNVGKIFRPGGEPLSPNYRWMPLGYHGRSSTVSIGSQIRRPKGQVKEAADPAPRYEPSQQLDFELEMGFIVGMGNDGAPIAPDDAGRYLFGAVLLCDWSARDVQAWEAQPLGPFLSKSFATTISPWVVTLDALEPYRVQNRAQDPPPLPYLRVREPWAFDIQLTASLQTLGMRKSWDEPEQIARVNFLTMYWNVAQQLAHLTSNGGIVRPGDLLGSGTVSGPEKSSWGSLLELTARGREPLALPRGEKRGFIEDGDEIIFRGYCAKLGYPRIGFGECRAVVLPAK